MVFVSIRAWVEVYACVAWPVTSTCPVDRSCFVQICLSRSGGEKGLRGSCAGTLGVALEGTRGVGEPLGFSQRVSGTVSHFRAEHGTSLETP